MNLIPQGQSIALPIGSKKHKGRIVCDLMAIGHFCGLFNQLQVLCGAILLGHSCYADVIIRGFYPQFQNIDIQLPLSSVIDLDRLNQTLQQLQFRCQVRDWNGENFPTVPLGDLSSYLKLLSTHPNPHFDLGKLYLHSIVFPSDPARKALHEHLLTELTFTTPFYTAVKTLTEHLNLKTYTSVHLRVEDDILLFTSLLHEQPEIWWETIRNRFQLELLKLPPNEMIFVASGLSELHLSYWQAIFPQMRWKTKDWRILTNSQLPEGREIDAIIDYLLTREADKFIGSNISTFSLTINELMRLRGKSSKLL